MRQINLLKTMLLAVVMTVGSVSVCGQSIWTNPINDVGNPSAANPYTGGGQTVNPNITVSGIGRGSGISGTSAMNRYNASGWNTASFNATQYFEFTLTPNADFQINLISFVYTGQTSGTGPTNFALRSSIDDYTENIVTHTTTGATIVLSAPEFQNLTSPITFRLYGWGASGSTGTFSVNSFTFNGIVCGLQLYTVTFIDEDEGFDLETNCGTITLPAAPTPFCPNWTFAGWKTGGTQDETTSAPTFIPVGSYTPTDNITLYSVYKKTEGDITTYNSNLSCPHYTVTLDAGTGSVTPTLYTDVTNMTLTEAEPPCYGWEFAGWKAGIAQSETTSAPTLIPVGSYTPTDNVTLYAVYKKTEGSITTYNSNPYCCSDLHFAEQKVVRTNNTNFTKIPIGGNGGTISYTSSNPSVASVNSVTGEVTLGFSGTAVIIATQEDFCDECGGIASYTIIFSTSSDCASMTSTGDVVFSEDFSGGLSQWTVDAPNPIVNCGASSRAFFGIRNGEFVVNGARGKTCCGNTGGLNDNYLISQHIDLSSYPAGSTITLAYKLRIQGEMEGLRPDGSFWCGATDEVESAYSTDGGISWTRIHYFLGDGCNWCSNSDHWTATYHLFECFTLPEGGNATFQVRFRMGNQAISEFYFLDDVIVTAFKPSTEEEPEEPCVIPSFDDNGSLPDAVCPNNPLDLECKAPKVLDNGFHRKGWLLDDVVYTGRNVTLSDNNKVLKYYAVNVCGDSAVIEIGNIIVVADLTRTENKTICAGETYNFYGTNYNTAQTGITHRFSNESGCDSIVTLNLTVNEILTRTENKTICQGETYNFYGTIFNAAQTGITHRFSNESGCDSIVTLNLTVNEILTRTENKTICAGETYNFYGTNYNTAQTGITHRFSNTTGCDSIVTLNLTVNEILTRTENKTICQGETYNFYGTNYNAAQTGITHRFSNTTGCDSIVTLNLTVKPCVLPCADISIVADKDAMCPNDNVKMSYEFSELPQGNYIVIWERKYNSESIYTQINLSNRQIVTETPTESATYRVRFIQENCERADSINITVWEIPQLLEIIHEKNSTYSFLVTGDNPPFDFSVDSNNPSNYKSSNLFENLSIGKHYLFVQDQMGCRTKIEFEIPEPELIIPKFFSPNDDGLNDYWLIKNLEQYAEVELLIYDRFQKLLLKLNNAEGWQGWDGKYLGKPMPSDDYWYILRLEKGKPLIGHFTLLR